MPQSEDEAQDAAQKPQPPEWTLTGQAEGNTPLIAGPEVAEDETIALVQKADGPGTLAEALFEFQTNPPEVVKDAEAEVKAKDGKTKLYDYKYLSLQALLAALRPRFAELGLLWRSKPGVAEGGKPVIYYSMTHVPSGEREEGTMPLIVGGTMQALGGSISFGRRYALISYLNLAPDVDEDGAIRPEHEVGGKKLTKKLAETLVGEAERLNLLPRLQLAASHVHGSDVGDCSTKAKAVTAMQKINEGEADRLFNKLAEIDGRSQPQATP